MLVDVEAYLPGVLESFLLLGCRILKLDAISPGSGTPFLRRKNGANSA